MTGPLPALLLAEIRRTYDASQPSDGRKMPITRYQEGSIERVKRARGRAVWVQIRHCRITSNAPRKQRVSPSKLGGTPSGTRLPRCSARTEKTSRRSRNFYDKRPAASQSRCTSRVIPTRSAQHSHRCQDSSWCQKPKPGEHLVDPGNSKGSHPWEPFLLLLNFYRAILADVPCLFSRFRGHIPYKSFRMWRGRRGSNPRPLP